MVTKRKGTVPMGVSTDAKLFYGIRLPEDFEEPEWMQSADQDDEYLKRTNAEGPERPPSENYRDAEWDAWRTVRNALIKTIPCEMDYEGSDGCLMHVVAMKGTLQTASRGYPIHPHMNLPADADEKIKAYCEVMGLPYSKPQWWLASWWG